MEIRLSSTDGVPVYRQIVNQVKYMVASGRLQPGQEMPTIRSLAEHLVINPNTVVRAYNELQRDGVLEPRHGSGTYVSESPVKVSAKTATKALLPKVDSLLTDASHLNIRLEELIDLVHQRHQALKQEKES